MEKDQFSIEDAFESDDEDPIRIYGATTDSAPLHTPGKAKVRPAEDTVSELLQQLNSDPPNQPTESHFSNDREIQECEESLLSSDHQQRSRWWKHPKVRENWKLVLASFFLLLIGIVLLVAGTVIEIMHIEGVQSFIFFIAGAICLIPGAYHVVYIYCAVKGKRGYSFVNLPVFK